ncbi:MAG: hypothetical protein J7501_07555, partial [Bdellovibrio sp.]|nr:hypothetical protein [Bdellovibrio sp.]
GKQLAYFCSIKYTKSSIEVPVSVSGNIYMKENGCLVGAEFANGKMLISYGPEKEAMDFDSAKACLNAALNKAGTVKAIIYTME